jgi:hypothetical protein
MHVPGPQSRPQIEHHTHNGDPVQSNVGRDLRSGRTYEGNRLENVLAVGRITRE